MPNSHQLRLWISRHSTSASLRMWLIVILLMCLGLAFRISLLRFPGYGFDMGVNQQWGRSLLSDTLAYVYRPQMGVVTPNYPPLQLLFFGMMARLHVLLVGWFGPQGPGLYEDLIRLPAILADLLTSTVLYGFVRRFRAPWYSLGLSALYLFHPVIWYNSAVWGQVDSIYTLGVFVAVVSLLHGWAALAGVAVALACLTKVQAVVFLPLIGLLLLPLRPRQWLECIGAAAVVVAMVLLPFWHAGTLGDVWRVYAGSVGFYPHVTLNAYNLWWALFGDHGQTSSLIELLPGLTYRRFGLFLFAASMFFLLAYTCRPILDRRRAEDHAVFTMLAGAVGTLCFFMFNTEMHERYSYSFVIFAVMAVGLRPRYALVFAVASVCAYFNLVGVLPFTDADRLFFRLFPTWDGVIANAFLVTTLAWLWQVRTDARSLLRSRNTHWNRFLTLLASVRRIRIWPSMRFR